MSDLWELRVRLLLSIQRALLGEVTPNIRAVTAAIDENAITLRWIIDGAIADDLESDLGAAGVEIGADFDSHQIAQEFLRCDAPRPMEEFHLEQLAYLRKE
jgi:hypothetical protein